MKMIIILTNIIQNVVINKKLCIKQYKNKFLVSFLVVLVLI